ncbi:MAG TPA: AmmeMemoRadiSam system protein A [Bacteroidota bacterium]|nr:AmmeMemoRadiSam system protein A [Bacteroidota bacterium]
MLADSEKHTLLQIARHSVESVVYGRDVSRIPISAPALFEPRAAFVTLRQHHELRGCIGYIDPAYPLWEIVEEMASKAAVDDPRFSPVEPKELSTLEIEISVLSDLRQIHKANEIEIGVHGVVAELRSYRGLLLPQVAVSAGWDSAMFLEETLRKSGMPQRLWNHSDVRLFVFSAEVFSEAAVSQD